MNKKIMKEIHEIIVQISKDLKVVKNKKVLERILRKKFYIKLD